MQNKKKTNNIAEDMNIYKLAVENAFDMVVITDREGKTIYANKAAEKISGYKRSEMIGKKAGNKELWGGQMDASYYKDFWNKLCSKKSFVGELKNKRKDGVIYDAEVSISPVLDDAGEILYFVSIERDITEQKKLDRAKTEFVSLASHQLRTPLSTISLSAEYLLKNDNKNLSTEQKECLSGIYDDIFKMSELIESLLNISKIEMGTFVSEPSPTEIFYVINDVLDEVRTQIINNKIIVRENIDKKIPEIITDKNIIRVVLQNLITNAVKYSRKNGKIEVSARKNKNDITIEVKDNGIGIPADQKEKIYSRYHRADNVTKHEASGTGLGLSIAKSLIEEIGGKIWYKSKIDKGTTFYVSIPLRVARKKVS